MNKTSMKKILSFILCMVLIAAMALFAAGCNDNTASSEVSTEASAASEAEAPGAHDEVIYLGEGSTEFEFQVIDLEGNQSTFHIHTDKTIVGEALEELGLMVGEEGPYGLFVKTVNGITADYDTDGSYWAFYIDGAYATSGVDTTEITAGTIYSMKVEK